jgi:NADPH:quinone reductase-like Zn-dependent oxidoreductase
MPVPATVELITLTLGKNSCVEVIEFTPDLPVLEPALADVVITVAYAGVNSIDTYFRSVVLFRHCTYLLTNTCAL